MISRLLWPYAVARRKIIAVHESMKKYSEHLPFIILFFVMLTVGLLTVSNYGESWDEEPLRGYGAYALSAYAHILAPKALTLLGSNLNYYGPAYFMFAALLVNGIFSLAPSVSVVVLWHAVYFMTFLASICILYLFALRWIGPWAAAGVALLYGSQPLLWGHAFINSKDVPFAAFFIATLYLGFRMVDAKSKKMLWVILAGVILGFTTSVRVAAPYAAFLIAIYAFWKDGKRALPYLATFAAIGLVVMYLTWPYLWTNPIEHLIESLRVMSRFPYSEPVLFQGRLYSANDLPASYVPTLLGLQLTEPLLVLFVFGLIISIQRFIKGEYSSLALFVTWFLLPTLAIIIFRSTLYDNIRQLLFLLPPLFIIAGLALDYIFKRVSAPVSRIIILLLLMAPGLLTAIKLHPYEYVYYNSLAGGIRGAFRSYEMDYWDTSFADIAQHLNEIAPQNSKVIVIGSVDLIRFHSRPDLEIVYPDLAKLQGGTYDYVVVHSRQNLDLRSCRDASAVYSVGRQGAVFAVIKKLTPTNKCP